METSIRNFCENIRQRKEEYRLSDRQLAMLLGISIFSVRKLLQGEVPRQLGADTVVRAAVFFDCPLSDLFAPPHK